MSNDSHQAKHIAVNPKLGACILAEELGTEIKVQEDFSKITSKYLIGFYISATLAGASIIVENIFKHWYGEQDISGFISLLDHSKSIAGTTIAFGSIAAVLKLTRKGLEKYSLKYSDKELDQVSNLAYSNLEILGVEIEDLNALTWTDGKVYLIKAQDGEFRIVTKPSFRKFIIEQTAKQNPLHSIYSSEDSIQYNRSQAGKLMDTADGYPSTVIGKLDKDELINVELKWHINGNLIKSQTLAPNLQTNCFEELVIRGENVPVSHSL